MISAFLSEIKVGKDHHSPLPHFLFSPFFYLPEIMGSILKLAKLFIKEVTGRRLEFLRLGLR